MLDDELDDLRDQEEALLEELDSVTNRETRQEILNELEELREEIEEKEQEQAAYLGTFVMDMLDEDEGFGDEDMSDDFSFDY